MCLIDKIFEVVNYDMQLTEVEKMYIRATEVVASNLVDLKTTYIMEANGPSAGEQPVVLSGTDLELHKEMSSTTSQESKVKTFACSDLCLKAGKAISYTSIEEVNLTRVSTQSPSHVVLYISNRLRKHFFEIFCVLSIFLSALLMVTLLSMQI